MNQYEDYSYDDLIYSYQQPEYRQRKNTKQYQMSTRLLGYVFIVILIIILGVLALDKTNKQQLQPPTSLQQLTQEFKSIRALLLNIQYTGIPFQNRKQFAIAITQQMYKQKQIQKTFKYVGQNRIMPASVLDTVNLSSIVNFDKLKEEMTETIAHQLITFQFDYSIQNKSDVLIYQQGEIQQINKKLQGSGLKHEFQIQIKFVKYPDDEHVRKMQYIYYHNKYQIGLQNQQLPICVIAPGYNLYKKNIYKSFFASMNRQNYTNFHIVWVDDNSPDQSAYHIARYLAKQNLRLNNRIKIIRNLQRVGSLGNLYFWSRKYCNDGEIVLSVDPDDSLIGAQAMKVFSAVYRKTDSWVLYTKYIEYHSDIKFYKKGISAQFQYDPQKYRTQQIIWVTSHTKTWKKQLFQKIPFQYMIEYHYDNATKLATPVVTLSSSDRYIYYPSIELAGKNKTHFLNSHLYLYEVAPSIITYCYRAHQGYDQFKVRAHTPLNTIKDLNEKPKPLMNYRIPQNILQALQIRYKQYAGCSTFK